MQYTTASEEKREIEVFETKRLVKTSDIPKPLKPYNNNLGLWTGAVESNLRMLHMACAILHH